MAKSKVGRMCKEKNRGYAFSLGVSLVKEMEKKSTQDFACRFVLPEQGEFYIEIKRTK